MKTSTTVALIAAAAAFAGAAVWVASSERRAADVGAHTESSEAAGKPLFPALAARLPSASTIIIKRPELAFSIVKGTDGVWRIPDKGDYPAKPETVRQALIGFSELREWEPKTNRPDMYAKLGVDEPAAPPPEKSASEGLPQSTLVTIKDGAGAVLADAIVGNKKWGQTPGQTGLYIRRNGEAQSWLAHGDATVPREILGWLDPQFANIDRSRIKSVTVRQPGAEPILVQRDGAAAPLALAGLPAGRELKDPGVAESIGSSLTATSLQDVAKRDTIDFTGGPDGKPGPTIEVRTFDGLVVTINAIAKEGRQWWALSASVDDAAVAPPAVAVANAGAEPDKPKPDPGARRKEADDLNSRWSPFAFAPVDFRAKAVNVTLDDLLKPATPDAPPASPSEGSVAPSPILPPPPGSGHPAPPGQL